MAKEGKVSNREAQTAVRVLKKIYDTQGHYIFRAAAAELCKIYGFEYEDKPIKFTVRMPIIQKVVCRYFVVSMDSIKGHSRRSEYNECRQIFVYLCRKMTFQSTPQIGKLINRDHSTIVHAEHKMRQRFDSDPEFKKLIQYLENLIIEEAEKDKTPKIDITNLIIPAKKEIKCQEPPKPNFDPPVWRPRSIRP